jgi:voltage-gated potassium channel
MNLQDKLYALLEDPQHSKASFYLNIFIYSLIIISILNLMLCTVEEYQVQYGSIFETIRNIIMPIFIVEYLLRFYASGKLEQYQGFKGKIRYFFSFYALVDLLSVLPYILINIGFNSSFIRSLRLLRIFRLFRAKKYAIFIKLMKNILFNIKEEMIVLAFFTVVILALLSFSIFEIEHKAQPKVFTDIFQTLWWAVATLTTVGYGDMYPITPFGKLITGIISIIGIAFIAIPGGMFASEFISQLSEKKEDKAQTNTDICPNCQSEDFFTLKTPSLELNQENLQLESIDICKNCKHIKAHL